MSSLINDIMKILLEDTGVGTDNRVAVNNAGEGNVKGLGGNSGEPGGIPASQRKKRKHEPEVIKRMAALRRGDTPFFNRRAKSGPKLHGHKPKFRPHHRHYDTAEEFDAWLDAQAPITDNDQLTPEEIQAALEFGRGLVEAESEKGGGNGSESRDLDPLAICLSEEADMTNPEVALLRKYKSKHDKPRKVVKLREDASIAIEPPLKHPKAVAAEDRILRLSTRMNGDRRLVEEVLAEPVLAARDPELTETLGSVTEQVLTTIFSDETLYDGIRRVLQEQTR